MSDTSFQIKPKLGEPCNRCGLCCIKEPCQLSREYIGTPEYGRCPALLYDAAADQYACDLLVNAHLYVPGIAPWGSAWIGEIFRNSLGIGEGCYADD